MLQQTASSVTVMPQLTRAASCCTKIGLLCAELQASAQKELMLVGEWEFD